MEKFTIVDARMGRGKSSAAIRYMNEQKGRKCFLYITPYLAEVERVCEKCDFEEPDCDFACKSVQLKQMMSKKKNIASTHALFSLMDEEAMVLARENGYCLIIDESLGVIRSIPVSAGDVSLMEASALIEVGDDGEVTWKDPHYSGVFNKYRDIANAETLYYKSKSMYCVMNPEKLRAFSEVIMLTYLFSGQIQKAYLDYYGFEYKIVGVERDEEGYRFSDRPDCPPPVDYSDLIKIIGVKDGVNELDGLDARMNKVGNGPTALSKKWFDQRRKNHKDICALRSELRCFFERRTESKSTERLWTTFKDKEKWLLGPGNRYSKSFLPLNIRATNAYKQTTCVAYLTNRFLDPNIVKFFSTKDIRIDPLQFALSEMLQFIWRSAIRDGKEIQLYIPSKRMRNLLLGWIKDTSEGR